MRLAKARISRSRVLSQKAINIPSVAPPTPCAVTSPTAGRERPRLRIGAKKHTNLDINVILAAVYQFTGPKSALLLLDRVMSRTAKFDMLDSRIMVAI